jgi:Na+/phosphate symporter
MIQLIVCVVGLLMYVLASNPKVSEIGRIMFWTGLLSFLLGGHAVIPFVR